MDTCTNCKQEIYQPRQFSDSGPETQPGWLHKGTDRVLCPPMEAFPEPVRSTNEDSIYVLSEASCRHLEVILGHLNEMNLSRGIKAQPTNPSLLAKARVKLRGIIGLSKVIPTPNPVSRYCLQALYDKDDRPEGSLILPTAICIQLFGTEHSHHDLTASEAIAAGVAREASCQAGNDGDCDWRFCPQEANNRANYQPSCPLLRDDDPER